MVREYQWDVQDNQGAQNQVDAQDPFTTGTQHRTTSTQVWADRPVDVLAYLVPFPPVSFSFILFSNLTCNSFMKFFFKQVTDDISM
jgi:hypothetical protein